MEQKTDVEKIAFYCEKHLELNTSANSDDYGYPILPLCVIDAVFSIGVTYTSTENVVNRFCAYFKIPNTFENPPLSPDKTLSISEFIDLYDKNGISVMTEKVFQNRNRTSPRGGILKSEAVYLFSQALKSFNVDYLNDMDKVVGNPKFESAIKKIPGQASGISLRYFYMLAGDKNYIKPDRMIMRFIEHVIGKKPSIEEATNLIIETCSLFNQAHPKLSPRKLDNLIWNYQRES